MAIMPRQNGIPMVSGVSEHKSYALAPIVAQNLQHSLHRAN